MRTSCEQTDNAFKKRVEEVFIKLDLMLLMVILSMAMTMIILAMIKDGKRSQSEAEKKVNCKKLAIL